MIVLATTPKAWRRPRGRTFAHYLALFVAVFAVSLLLTDPAYAQAADGITSMADNIKTWLTGTFAKTIAVIAVVIVGFMFFTGRASLGLLVTVIVGIFIVFSAQWIVDTITGGA
jgi:type IV secretion system protein VirB2